jgi:hypothetical protein
VSDGADRILHHLILVVMTWLWAVGTFMGLPWPVLALLGFTTGFMVMWSGWDRH